MCRALEHQLMRPTDVGQPESFSAAQINDAIAAWESRRGLTVSDRSWFEIHKAKARTGKRERNPEAVARGREKQKVRAISRSLKHAAEVLANPGKFSPLMVARVRVEQARRNGGEAAARAESRKLKAEADARAAAARREKVEADQERRMAKLETLNTMSRVRTLIEHAKRTGGPEAVEKVRKQFAAERRARKAADQRERRARQKQKKQK